MSTTVTLPQTFRGITNLSSADLNGILRQFDLPTKGKRTNRYTLLTRHLNIKTDDAGDQDPFLQTLQDITSLKHGWTKDTRKVQHITLDQIKPGISMQLMTSLRKIQKAALRNIRKTAFILTKPCVPTPCGNRAISVAICSTLAALLGGSSFKGNKATRYGQRQEPKAVAEYLALMKSSHKRCSVEECGLVISKESPDPELDSEPPWFCPNCARNRDIVL
ncbi:hypothetical protein DPMN_053336 [Dreissena polymorpha]|uniref:Uncharacterized protein n=1 Tax=Dreissena polymorpha TaxID=45954 RepID=A0A9D4CMV1_DREPO|nr:hypothetical protein DPMN_053336 [Dreissena polymorpha]